MVAPKDKAAETRTFSSGFTRIMDTMFDLFVNIVTQSSVPPDGRDCTRDLHSSSVGDDQRAN